MKNAATGAKMAAKMTAATSVTREPGIKTRTRPENARAKGTEGEENTRAEKTNSGERAVKMVNGDDEGEESRRGKGM